MKDIPLQGLKKFGKVLQENFGKFSKDMQMCEVIIKNDSNLRVS